MTKEAYFEMCDALGSEPIESEIPVEFDDLHLDVQEAMSVYSKLKDEWDTMNGIYMGKNFSGLSDIMDIIGVPAEDKKTLYDLICLIDTHRSKAIEESRPKPQKTK